MILDRYWHRDRRVNDDDAKVACVATPVVPVRINFSRLKNRPRKGYPDEKNIEKAILLAAEWLFLFVSACR